MSKYTVYFRVEDSLISVELEPGELVQDTIDNHVRLGWKPVWATSPNAPAWLPQGQPKKADYQQLPKPAAGDCKHHPGAMRNDREGNGRYCHTKLSEGPPAVWCGYKLDKGGKVLKTSKLDQDEIPF